MRLDFLEILVLILKVEKGGNKKMSRNERVSCESCTYYIYDEDYESYVCDKNMDEDEYIRLMTDRHFQCPFYRNGDEYAVVRKQM